MPSASFYIYEHIRPDTGTVFYVGKGRGWRKNATNRNQHWKRVVAKAGGFSIRMVAENVDEELAFLIEVERIDQLRFLGVGLCNMTNGGEGTSGRVCSEESKRKTAAALTGRRHSDERIAKRRGRAPSEEARRNMSEAQKKRAPASEETRRKIGESNAGKVRSEETKKKMSAAQSNRSAETRRKMSVGKMGHTVSEETRRKISEAKKANPYVATEGTRMKLSKALKGRIMTEEHKRKISEAHRIRLTREKRNWK